MQIKTGSMWATPDRKKFIVEDVKFEDGETWVYYKNVETQVEHFCLEDAFVRRFSEIVNNY